MSDETPKRLLGRKEIAQALGVTGPYINHLVARGMPQDARGKYDEEACKAWYLENTEPGRMRAGFAVGDGSSTSVYQKATPLKKDSDARIAFLKAQKLEGALIDRDSVLRAIEGRALMERDSWIAWASKAAVELVSVERSVGPIAGALDRMIREHLEHLAKTPLPAGLGEDG